MLQVLLFQFSEEELDDLHSVGSENRNGSADAYVPVGKLMEFIA